MHGDAQTDSNEELVRALLREQFPQWVGLSISRADSDGTVNSIFRVGTELAARLPLAAWAEPQISKDHTWLPRIAPFVPLEVPTPVAIGEPGQGFPWKWAVHSWIEGEPVTADGITDMTQAVDDLANFVHALHSIELPDAPMSERNVPIDTDENLVLWAIEELRDEFDADALRGIWRDAVAAPAWAGSPILVHADLMNGNILARDGRIVAVIDWGLVGLGEPANDLDPAWELFDDAHRRAFAKALDIDDATWVRARGWAVKSTVGVLYYRDTNPSMVRRCRRRLEAVLGDAAN
jgi:aminoglycoside phosphotransferase (APT) family kinase protein